MLLPILIILVSNFLIIWSLFCKKNFPRDQNESNDTFKLRVCSKHNLNKIEKNKNDTKIMKNTNNENERSKRKPYFLNMNQVREIMEFLGYCNLVLLLDEISKNS